MGTVDGTPDFNPIVSETDPGVAIPNSTPATNRWVTWALNAPLQLDPNTLYAFDVDPSGSGFIGLTDNNNDIVAGSTGFSSGGGGNPANPLTLHNWDRAFHVDLAANAAAVPEPASVAIWSLLGFTLAGFGYYRIRRKK